MPSERIAPIVVIRIRFVPIVVFILSVVGLVVTAHIF
jgi:hypothetical protein